MIITLSTDQFNSLIQFNTGIITLNGSTVVTVESDALDKVIYVLSDSPSLGNLGFTPVATARSIEIDHITMTYFEFKKLAGAVPNAWLYEVDDFGGVRVVYSNETFRRIFIGFPGSPVPSGAQFQREVANAHRVGSVVVE